MVLALTASTEVSSSGIPRVRLAVSGAATAEVYVDRLDPDGRVVSVRSADPAVTSGGALVVFDYEAAFDVAVSYTVRDTDTSPGSDTSAPVTLTSGGVAWIVHPGLPATLSVPLGVLEWPTWSRPVQRGVFQPIGRKFPVVVSSRRGGESGDLVVYTSSHESRDAMEAILSDGLPLLLKGTSTENAGTRWVSVGDVSEQPFEADLRGFIGWILPLVAVDSPAGSALPAVTYADASAAFFSYAVALSQAPTYADRSGGEWKV